MPYRRFIVTRRRMREFEGRSPLRSQSGTLSADAPLFKVAKCDLKPGILLRLLPISKITFCDLRNSSASRLKSGDPDGGRESNNAEVLPDWRPYWIPAYAGMTMLLSPRSIQSQITDQKSQMPLISLPQSPSYTPSVPQQWASWPRGGCCRSPVRRLRRRSS
jgi:hypothetical protein